MIYKFRIISDENDRFLRIIEINDDKSFLDFHDAIQSSVEYDQSQLASFYISDKNWGKGEQITLLDMADEADGPSLLMEDVLLKDFLCTIDETLIYVFDFFSDRAFYITLMAIKGEEEGIQYPICVKALGDAPEQIRFDDTSLQNYIEEESLIKNEDGVLSKKSLELDEEVADEIEQSGYLKNIGSFEDLDSLYGELDEETFQ